MTITDTRVCSLASPRRSCLTIGTGSVMRPPRGSYLDSSDKHPRSARANSLPHPNDPDYPSSGVRGLRGLPKTRKLPNNRIVQGSWGVEQTVRAGHIVYHADPHREYELSTQTGCTILFMQYQGPTTRVAPLYDGRMNLKEAESEEELDLNL